MEGTIQSLRRRSTLGSEICFSRTVVCACITPPRGCLKPKSWTPSDPSECEVVGGTRSRNYDFGFAELHFPASEKGEGKLAPANLISFDKVTNQIEIENYGTQPVRLLSVTSKTP